MELPVTILIAAKNEERNIPELLKALHAQNYTREKREIIIVDDNSDDETFRIALKLAKEDPFIKVIKAHDKEFFGKKGALSYGVAHANNPYILITDADCKPSPGWIHAFVNKFSAGYDILFGAAPFIQGKSWVNKIACFEELRSSILTFGLAKIGLPYSAAARSFGYTRKAFDQIGGYRNTIETLSGDDDLLIREAVKHNLRIGTVLSDDSKVYSETKTSFKEYLLQKARHTSTANYYLLKHRFILAAWHLLNIIFLFSPLLSGLSKLFWLPLIFKLFTDLIIVKRYKKRFGYKFSIGEIIILQILYETMLIVIYLLSFFRKEKW